MTTVLHLGVVDIPYTKGTPAPRRVGVRRRAGVTSEFSAPAGGQQTTGDVAEILEDTYHVMEVFYEAHADEIGDMIADTIGDAIDSLTQGAPIGNNATAAAEADIQNAFQKFISSEEMAGLGVPGVPTAAALAGVNHRLAHPYAKANLRRPSFRDTGLYMQSMRAWFD